MFEKLSAEIAEIGLDLEIDIDASPEPPDPLAKFRETAQLAAALGDGNNALGWARADRLATSFADISANFERAMRQPRRGPLASGERTEPLAKSGWEEEIAGADDALAKRHSGTVTFSGYREWLQKGMAAGRSANEVINEWCSANPGYNVEVERLLRAVAADL